MSRFGRGGRIALSLVFVSAFLVVSLPGSAQERVGDCIADASGHFPAAVLGCTIRIPRDTPPGEYNLVGRCPNGGTGSASYASSSGGMAVSTNRVNPGQEITPTGDGCQANSMVNFTLERIGALVGLGDSFVQSAYAQTGTRTLTARISVVGGGTGGTSGTAGGGTSGAGTTSSSRADTTAARGGALARTGLQVLPWLASGLLALTLGGALVFAGRRRRNGMPNSPV